MTDSTYLKTARHPRPAALCYFVFFLSGAAALIYEISWSRQIGLLFGHTVHAAAVVLATYFAGMAIGHLIGAKWSTRVSPLFGYGVAELVVVGWACLIPEILSLSESPMFASWLSSEALAWQTTARVVFCFLLLLPATTALGVTLPMMSELLSSQQDGEIANSSNAARVSLAYALNTAGAVMGVLSATFYLLVITGVRTSSYIAAGVSGVCAIAALVADRISQSNEREESEVRNTTSQILIHNESSGSEVSTFESRPSSNARLFWFFLAALSGFCILAFEVLYTRMFALVFHNSTYTFGAVVAVFLASLALGAAITALLQQRYPTEDLAGWICAVGALASVLSVFVFVTMTNLDYYSYGESFLRYLTGAFLLVALTVAPPITLLGMLLPLVWKAAGRGKGAGHIVGWLTAVNTISGAAGSLAASFLLLPYIGLWQSFAVLGVPILIIGLVLLLRNQRQASACGVATAFIGLTLLALYSPSEPINHRTQIGERLVRRWNSPYGWIDVVRHEKTGSLRVRQNLHYRFGRTGDNAREYRQAHLPLLLHEQPQDVLFMGLGTGLTSGGAIPHREVEGIVAVELIPEVVEAARLLSDHNFGVVDHEKVKIQVDDARHYLLSTKRRFDVIVSDLFVPWESESGYMYTVENYRVARRRLKSGGLLCQWLPLYQLGVREFELIANSFANVFPLTTIWWGEMDAAKPVVALVGREAPLELHADRLAVRLAALRQNTKSSDNDLLSAEQFFKHYQGDWSPRIQAHLNTDEHPRVEFLTPISNRDHRTITGGTLLNYYDDVLCHLQQRDAIFHDAKATAQQRREWRRFILFGGTVPSKN